MGRKVRINESGGERWRGGRCKEGWGEDRGEEKEEWGKVMVWMTGKKTN